MIRFLVALVLLALMAPAAAAQVRKTVVGDAVAGLKKDPIYVAPGADPGLTEAERSEIENAIEESGGAPLYVVALPPGAVKDGRDAGRLLREIGTTSKLEGTFVLAAGEHVRAGSTLLEEGQAADLAAEAVLEHGDDGLAAIVEDFAERVGDARAGRVTRESGDDDGGGPKWWLAGVLVLPLALLLWYAWRIRRAGPG